MKKAKAMWGLPLTLAIICLACATGIHTEGDEVNSNTTLSARCAESLRSLAKSSGITPSLEGNRLRIGQDELRLSAHLENEGQAQSQYAVGLAVDVSVNGTTRPLTAGAVGIGANREEAVETAVSEWAQLAGVALLDALGVKKQSGLMLNAGRFSIHPGLTGIRGSQDVVWSDDSQRKLLDTLNALIHGLEASPSEFHSISIMLVVQPGDRTDGECRVDGTVSAEALKAVQSFSWPPTTKGYMFKQFYVLRQRET